MQACHARHDADDQNSDTCAHVWPSELDQEARCLTCSLAYPEWTQEPSS